MKPYVALLLAVGLVAAGFAPAVGDDKKDDLAKKDADPVSADLRRVEEAGQVGQPSAVPLVPAKLATRKKAADAGVPDRLYHTRCLQEGFRGGKDDEQAARLLRKAADADTRRPCGAWGFAIGRPRG